MEGIPHGDEIILIISHVCSSESSLDGRSKVLARDLDLVDELARSLNISFNCDTSDFLIP